MVVAEVPVPWFLTVTLNVKGWPAIGLLWSTKARFTSKSGTGDCVGVAVGVGTVVGDGVAVGVGVVVGDGIAVGVGVVVGDGLIAIEGDGVGETGDDGVGEAKGVGVDDNVVVCLGVGSGDGGGAIVGSSAALGPAITDGSESGLSGAWVPTHAEIRMTETPRRHITTPFEGGVTLGKRNMLVPFITIAAKVSDCTEPQ